MNRALAALFIGAGALQLAGTGPARRAYARWGYPDWFRIAVGVIEIEAGILAAFEATHRAAVLQLIPIMAGSIHTHGKTQGERHMSIVPALILAAMVYTLCRAD